MKHTILSLMLAFLAGLSTLSAANYSGTCGNDLIWTLNTNDSILIIYGSGAMDDYSSSSSAPWYSYRSKIKGVNLPNELTSIGNYAFNDCSNLASITFNENLESIGSYSFYKCKALKSIYLPNSITSIGDKAFASSLATTITIEKNTPPSIGKNVFPSGTMIDNSSGLPEIVEIRTTIYVPCELVQIYQTQWKDYSSRITNIPFPYTIGILLKSQGTLLDSQNDVSVACDNGFKLSAPTYTGYHFTQWSDGNTDNPRSVDVASNTVFTAEYEINYYSLHLSCDTSKGSVSPLEGTYAHSSDVVISATPKQGFKFQRWSDADTNNPRTLTLYKDVELSAIFVAEDPIKAISVNGELIPIADTMFVYDEHESTYIPQIETLTKSETANAEVVRLDNTDYGWNAIVHIKESNVILKEYTLFIFSNSNKQKVRITLTGEDRTSFSLSSNTDAFSSVVGNTRHETKYNTFSSYTGYKLGNKPSHIGLLFPLGTLQQGDIVSVLLTQESDIGEGEMFFYSDEGITPIKTIQGVYKPGLYSFVLGNNAPQLRSIYLYRNDMEMNPYVAYLEISRIHSAFTYSISCNELKGQVNIENNIGIIKAEAIPNKGYHFTQWSDGVTDNLRTIILTQDTVITAEFSANKYDISVTCDTTQGSIAGASGEFDYMSNLTYRAIPNNGYQFSIWSDGVTDNPRTIVLTRDTVITALYNINYYKVDFVDWDNSILKSDSVEYLFAAVPPTDPVREGYTFIGWDKEVPSVTQDTVITALYNINRYTISVICDTTQGTIEGASGEYDYLTQLSYTAIPHEGYQFSQWSDGNIDNPRTIILAQDTTIYAEFIEYHCVIAYGTCGDSITWALSCDSVLTIEGTGAMTDYRNTSDIPWYETIDAINYVIIGMGVKSIGKTAFAYCRNLSAIEIPNSVTSIGISAFYNCESLTSIKIPNSIINIGEWAFYGCGSLKSIEIPNSITRINDYVFEGCSGFTSVKIPNSVTSIGMRAFRVCSGLTSVIIGNSVTSIGDFAFDGCSSLSSIDIPNRVTNVGNYAFRDCSSLTSITIPNSVTNIGENIFSECTGLTSIYVPCGELERFMTMLNNDSRVQYSPLPYTITTFAENGTVEVPLCYGEPLQIKAIPNKGYHFVQWSDGITYNPRTIILTQDTTFEAIFRINRYQVQFVDWNGSVLFTDSVDYGASAIAPANPTREGYTFIGWDKEVPSVTQDTVITALYNINRYTISVICDTTQGTIEGASGEYDYLTQLSYTAIPNVGYTFTQWSDGITDNPRTIILTQDTTFTAEFWMEGNCLLLSETRGDSIKWELSCDSILTIEGNGTWGGSEQFNFAANKKAVKKVIIKDGVKRIGAMSFLGLENIVSIEIPNSVTSIGDAAFGHCSSLTSITLPTNLTSLGKRAFNACTSLTTIVWNAKNCFAYTDNTYSSFYSVKGNITTFVIGDSVEYLPSELCSGMNKLSAVHISDIAAWCRINFENSKTANPLYYAHHLYLNNEEIINLVIPEGVTEISNRAFAGYSAMKTVSIPSTVVRIGHTAFDGCTGLTSVVIPDGVTTIGNTAFTRCSNLQSVVLGDNVTTIGEGVFTECTSLKSPIYNRHTFLCMPTSYSGAYLVPDGIKTIAGSAFYKCKGLTSIDIPNSVTALGEAAFRECTKLEEVTIGTGVTALGKNVFNKCASIKKVQWNAINYRQSKPNTDTNCFPFYASRDSITSFIFGDSVEYIPVYLLKDFSAINNLVIPASVTEIGEYAFTNDTLVEITCYAETPPVIDSTAVVGVNKSTCILYVPYTSVNAYRNAEVWKEFVNIQAIGAEEVEEPGDAIVVTPSSTSASLIWTLISNAATYELVIRDMNGNVICTLTFNALGQLTGIAFAPNRSREAQQTQAAGFQFTVSGLNSGTTYEYALTAFDENDNIIETLTGTFTTTNDVSTDIEQMNEDALNIPQKIMRDGNVYILRGDKVFTLHGQEVK